MISIKDVARVLGVTPSTVSRALNRRPGVSRELAAKIIKTCQDMGYEKNSVAASLITNKTRLIGFVIPDITSPYYAQVAKGVSTYLNEHGYGLILCNANRNADIERKCFELLASQRVDGVLVISITADARELIKFKQRGQAIVQIDNEITPELSSVVNDNYSGAKQLFEHMIKMNCRRIGCILGLADNRTTKERLRAFRDVMNEYGIDHDPKLMTYISATWQNGYNSCEALLRHNPDAIFAINDTAAMGVLRYCIDHGIKVPHELKVAGFDDIEVTSMISVPLTTVHQKKITLGRKAAEQLLYEIEHPHERACQLMLAPFLRIRESCGEKLRGK